MSREASLNPIFLMGKTSTSSLYHSFYLIDIEDKNELRIHFRFPKTRRDIEDVESGVKYFLSELDLLNEDNFGSFVVTTSDGSRFFASYRGSSKRLFVAVSIFPLMTFTRSVFTLLKQESLSTLPQVMSTLCEFPIIDTPGARYEVKLSGGTIPLQFNRLGMVDDFDMYTIALRLLSPQMMVDAWECLMLEYKVLVLSSCKEVIPPCCEFLRRMVSPLVVVNTYVPLLPSSLLNAIEAPFPYLVGAQTDEVLANFIDLTDTAVIYLDEQRVQLPQNEMTPPHEMAPKQLKCSLMKQISDVMLKGLSNWVSRPCDNDDKVSTIASPAMTSSCSNHPMSANIQINSAVKIYEIFLWQNLSLLGARHCDVRAFFRQCERPFYKGPNGEPAPSKDAAFRLNVPKHRGADGRVSSMGFSCRSGVYCGCMQLLNERKDIDILQFLPCWVELDKERLAVHEFADEMPLISVLAKNIMAVSPSAAEPEGHVFDLHVGSQMTYRFAATDPDSRREWIRVIEKMTTKSPPSPAPHLISPTPRTDSSGDLFSNSSIKSNHVPVDIPLDNSQDSSTVSDDDQISAFRMHVGHTQMVSYYKSSTDFEEYESVLTGPGHRLGSSTFLTSGEIVKNEDEALTEIPTPRLSLQTRKSSSHLRESDTELCSPLFLKDLVNIWKLFISNEVSEKELSTEIANMSTATAKSNSTLWLRQSADYLKASYLFLGKKSRDYKSQKECLKVSANAIQDGRNLENAEKEKSFLTNLFFKSNAKEDQKKDTAGSSSRKAASSMIKTELNLRNAASEIIQRLAASHRQCEADLRKMLVSEKMTCTANIIDCNALMLMTGGHDVTWDSISLDIKAVCDGTVTGQSKSWQETTDAWIDLFADVSICDDNGVCLTDLRSNIKTSIKEEIEQRRLPHGMSESDYDSNGDSVDECNGDDEVPTTTGNGVTNDDSSASVFPSHILVPLLQSMDGYSCRQSKNNYSAVDQRNLLATYGKGSLMDQRRLMRCLVAVFLDHVEKDDLVEKERQVEEERRESNVTRGDEEVPFARRLSHPLEFPDIPFEVTTPPPPPLPKQSKCGRIVSYVIVKEFLFWAVGINDIIGLQAVRLISELILTQLTTRMAERITEQSLALEIPSTAGEFEREVAYGIYSRKRVSISNMQPTFIWAHNTPDGGASSGGVVRDKSSQNVLNEIVLCKNTAVKACELSIQLLSSLREILRAADACGTLNNERRLQPGNGFSMQLTETQRLEISKSSAFRSFEIQSCQMQMVDINGMDDNSKAVFFCNIFNVMTIHALMGGLPSGTSFYEKYNFMRNTKYNISGMVLSLLEIEHNILRAQTSSPYSIFGPVSIKTSSFSERDPKFKLTLKKAFPLVSFVLFTASVSSPPLTTLWDPSTVKQEMRRSTAQYLQEHIQVDKKNKSILVPEQFRWYWKDFGGAKMKVLNTVIHLCADTAVAAEIADLLKITQKPRIAFVNFDW
eukprot:CAMPEP_0114417838 /NCGR_PEP_ID=MMETSP0103-20121206/3177_1 /TAXON_ID=37642 ORGANISM="Paraphysomonas imperforata, Strain PA2" /NCGR_SAMPLE_ID=MMETSP0103 /ASSEMBLY_ACC=CAM_ASM_000201 /LENGTH=1467 /DNA_ID=CAMNT_0001586157 /DNA_START=55 /DNA_END=4455 /DNA_ORIENTATION=-